MVCGAYTIEAPQKVKFYYVFMVRLNAAVFLGSMRYDHLSVHSFLMSLGLIIEDRRLCDVHKYKTTGVMVFFTLCMFHQTLHFWYTEN